MSAHFHIHLTQQQQKATSKKDKAEKPEKLHTISELIGLYLSLKYIE